MAVDLPDPERRPTMAERLGLAVIPGTG